MAYDISIRQPAPRLHPEQIPTELQQLRQWVCWRYETRDGKATKVPYRVKGWGRASSTEPATWGTFSEALVAMEHHQHSGIGFVFADDWAGVDIDNCRDPETTIIKPWAIPILVQLAHNTYWEVSVSGTGLHGIGKGKVPGPRRKAVYGDGAVEMYDADSPRYFTVTGDVQVPGPIGDITAGLEAVYQMVFPPEPDPPPLRALPTLTLDDQRVLELAFRASNSAETRALYDGDMSSCDNDHSAADLALQSRLAFYTDDGEQLDRLHRGSALYRKKWDRADYRERTIAKALQQRNRYDPGRPTATPVETPSPDVTAYQARIAELEAEVAREKARADRAEEAALGVAREANRIPELEEQARRNAERVSAIVAVLRSNMDPSDKVVALATMMHVEAREKMTKHKDPERGVRLSRDAVAAAAAVSVDSVSKTWGKLTDAGYWKRSETSWYNPEEGTGKKPHTETNVWVAVEGTPLERLSALANTTLPRRMGGKRTPADKVYCKNCGKSHIIRKVFTECQDCGEKWDKNEYDVNERIQQENEAIERERLIASQTKPKVTERLLATDTPHKPQQPARLWTIPPPVEGMEEYDQHTYMPGGYGRVN